MLIKNFLKAFTHKDGTYHIAWKSVKKGATDQVIAITEKTSTDTTQTTYRFKTAEGLLVNTTALPDTGKYKLNLTNNTTAGETYIEAWKTIPAQDTSQSSTEQLAGRLNLAVYEGESFTLQLVPMGDASCSPAQAQTALNDIYQQAAVTWQVSAYQKDFNPTGWDEDEDGLVKSAETQFLSNYTSEMNNIISAFKKQVNTDRKTYYLFLVPGFSDDLAGFMPLGRNYGFIDANTTDVAKTIAHELGHGTFVLYHPFSDNSPYFRPEGSTDNLMDYSDGTFLNKYQWDLINNPRRIVRIAQDEGEGKYERGFYYARHEKNGIGLKNNADYYTFITPAGLPYSLPNTATDIYYGASLVNILSDINHKPDEIYTGNDVLTGFTIDDNVFIAKATKEKFIGYIPKKSTQDKIKDANPRKDDYTVNNLDKINIFELKESKKNNVIEQTKIFINKTNEEYYGQGPLLEPCDKCGKIMCNGRECVPCPNCGEYGNNCYCGKACICFAHEPTDVFIAGTCPFNRTYQKVGIPYFNEKGDLVDIKKLSLPTTDEAESYRNSKILMHGYMLYYKKLGIDTEVNLNKIINDVANLTDVLEDVTPEGSAKTAFKRFNQLYSAYGVYDAFEKQEYAKALFNAIKYIPVAGEIVGGFESILRFVYSEEFSYSILNRVERELTAIGGCKTEFCNMKRDKLYVLENFAKDNIKDKRNDNLEILHDKFCTCPK